MKASLLNWAALAFAALVAVAVLARSTGAYVTSFPEEPDIDGTLITVGLAVAKFLAGLVPYPGVSALLLAIIHAWEPKPEDNYWDHVKDNVAQVCGDFVNEHNLEQVVVYKNDLVSLLKKYERAGPESDGTYPDKNTVADAITTSIISNRYLVEATEMPWSMSVDFVDVAGVHVLVLKDVAETYSDPAGDVSRWWVDLSRELDHYIEYGTSLQAETLTWRDSQIECFFDEASGGCLAFDWMGIDCYDEYVIKDHVTGYQEKCNQLHPDKPEDGSCASFCSLYQRHVDQDSARWVQHNLGSVVEEWAALKLQADAMAQQASRYYNPLTKDNPKQPLALRNMKQN
ncbi:uncharacterized protein LOC122250680 [Penaeus japonicus]|uniref:uncharacterized protein LOC122250680 n=1 Tax=Penaeus japonicus TaxID=27405 RepID=UPI001C7156FA|nr:uncharacterized protein LOC122250680 [Penaeus japonicus]